MFMKTLYFKKKKLQILKIDFFIILMHKIIQNKLMYFSFIRLHIYKS